MASSSPAVFDEIDARYGECAVAPAEAAALRCCVHEDDDDGRVLVHFTAPDGVDAFAAALALLEHPAHDPLFREAPPCANGWRAVAGARSGATAVVARASVACIDRSQVPQTFLVDLIVNQALAVQRELLFVHAAAIVVDGAGVLIAGASGRGKTTTALTLASRGHGYLGDEMAAIRTASRELVPLRSTANVRPGPHARALDGWLERGRWTAPQADGLPRMRLRVASFFAQAPAVRAPLRRALFLRGFAPAPAVERFVPTPQTWQSRPPLALKGALWMAWATTPRLRLLQFLLFARTLATVPCAWLDVGSPESTAELIEQTMEGPWD